MKKLPAVIIGFLLLTASYSTIASISDVKEKTPFFDKKLESNKKYYFCYVEIEGVADYNWYIMHWGFPFLTYLFFGEFDDLDEIIEFMFLGNVTFPYKDATISIYQRQGGKLLYEQHNLEQVKFCFFVGFYDSVYYYKTFKGNVFFVEPM